MKSFFAALVLAAVAAVDVNAQSLPVSAGCASTVTALAVNKLSCLQLLNALPIFGGGNGSSIIGPIDTYLGKLCPAGPVCTQADLSDAEGQLKQSCASDISGGGAAAEISQIVIGVLGNYNQTFSAVCSKNSTSNGYCVTEVLTTIQNQTGTSVSIASIAALLNGGEDVVQQYQPVLESGQLCTGCVAAILNDASKTNSTLASSGLTTGLQTKCGADFGKSAPSDVSLPSAGSGSASGSSPSISTTPIGSSAVQWLPVPLAVVGATVASVLLGAAKLF